MTRAIYAYGSGLGFALGGLHSIYTDGSDGFADIYTATAVPGMVVYNASSEEWHDVSTTGQSGYSSLGFAMNGAAQFVPSFGPNGLVFVFGGYTSSSDVVACC